MMYKKTTVLFILLFQVLSLIGIAQQRQDSTTNASCNKKRFAYIPEPQTLRSTHGTFFSGGNMTVCKPISHSIILGAGIEFASCHYHEDNRAKLRRLRFLPLMIDCKLRFNQAGIFIPYVQLSEGISFIRYKKEDEVTEKKPYNVSEKGNYAYLGVGTIIHLSDHIFPTIGIGLKGFHMSTNVLDVNPHGIAFRIGYIFRPGTFLNSTG